MYFFEKFARIVILLMIILVSVLTIYLIYKHHGSVVEFYQLLYYFGIPIALLVLLLIILLCLHTTYQITVVIILIPIISAFYAAELFLFFSPPLTNARVAKNLGIPYDTRSIRGILDDLDEQGEIAFPAINVNLFSEGWESDGKKRFPIGGISNVLTINCNESGEFTFYQSDEHGFHNTKGLYEVKNLTIAVLGDSFVHGNCVQSDKNAVAIIKDTYPNTINLGISGNGPLLMLATLKEYAKQLKPRIVLWSYFEGNDLKELNVEKKNHLLLQYLKQGYKQNLFSIQSEIDENLKEFVKQESENHNQKLKEDHGIDYSFHDFLLLDHLRTRLGLYYMVRKDTKPNFDLFKDILVSAQNAVASWGGNFYFIYLPQIEHFKGFRARHQISPQRDQVLNLIKSLKIPIIDVYDSFITHDDPLSLFPFRMGYHYNEEGYKMFAETVLNFIENDI